MEKLTPYREIAKLVLTTNKFKQLDGTERPYTEVEAQNIITTATYNDIEKRINAHNSVKYGVEGVSRCLGLTRNQTEAFMSAVFGQDNIYTTSDQTRILSEVKTKVTPNVQKFALALYSIQRIHDHWVMEHAEQFVNPKDVDGKYQHLPLQMIGWKEAQYDLMFLSPVLDSIDLDVNTYGLHLFFDKKVKEFYEKNGFVTLDGQILTEKVADAIMKGKEFYPPLKEVNTAKTKEEAIEIAKQSEEKTTTYSRSLK